MPKAKKFDWSRFLLKIAINVSPEKVFKAWTDGKIVSKWFSVKAEIEPKKNGRIYYEWLAGDKLEARIIEIVKNRKLVIPFGSKGEIVEVKIKKHGRGSICELRQYNMKTGPKDRVNMHMGCKTGWTFFLTNLKSYLEHGIDLRSNDKRRSYRQNFVNS